MNQPKKTIEHGTNGKETTREPRSLGGKRFKEKHDHSIYETRIYDQSECGIVFVDSYECRVR